MWILSLILLLGPILVLSQPSNSPPVVKKWFKKERVVPDVLDAYPANFLEVIYPERRYADLANKLSTLEVQYAPRLVWPASKKKLYTVAMVDPDAMDPQNPTDREFRHWLVINVPGLEVGKGTNVTEYKGPDPPPEYGYHRYVVLVYEQKKKLKGITMNNDSQGRRRFHIQQFAYQNGMGHPVAGNFFYTKPYED